MSTPALYEAAVRRREGLIAHLGPLVVRTGHHTGRSPNDKFIVKEPSTESEIWRGDVNRPFEEERFDAFYVRLLAHGFEAKNRHVSVAGGHSKAGCTNGLLFSEWRIL